MKKIVFKKMHVYKIHRSNELDHENGRPAIILKFNPSLSLVWCGTTQLNLDTSETPLILKINKTQGYFYAKGIEKVKSTDLKSAWVDFKTHKAYKLSSAEQQNLISKFISFTEQLNPYFENIQLKANLQKLLDWNKELQEENSKLKIQLGVTKKRQRSR